MSGGLSASIVLYSTSTRRHVHFKVHDKTDAADTTLPHSPVHAGVIGAVHISKTTSAQLQLCIVIVADWQAQSRNLGG